VTTNKRRHNSSCLFTGKPVERSVSHKHRDAGSHPTPYQQALGLSSGYGRKRFNGTSVMFHRYPSQPRCHRPAIQGRWPRPSAILSVALIGKKSCMPCVASHAALVPHKLCRQIAAPDRRTFFWPRRTAGRPAARPPYFYRERLSTILAARVRAAGGIAQKARKRRELPHDRRHN